MKKRGMAECFWLGFIVDLVRVSSTWPFTRLDHLIQISDLIVCYDGSLELRCKVSLPDKYELDKSSRELVLVPSTSQSDGGLLASQLHVMSKPNVAYSL